MEIDFAQLTAYQRYKLMASLIVPRPIALVTTLGANGVAFRKANTPKRIVMAQRMRLRVMSVIRWVSKVSKWGASACLLAWCAAHS